MSYSRATAVVGDMQRAIFIGHRLMTGRHVDDAQAAMAEPDVAVDEDSLVVRPTMPDHIAHLFEHVARKDP